jgi:hypothetical protein
MKTQASDTSPEMEKLQFDLMRKAGPGARAAAMRSLSAFIIDISREALVKSYPHDTEQERLLRWVENSYGKPLACAVRERLESKSQETTA